MTKTTSMPKLKTNFRNEIVFWRPWNISTYLENKNLICMYMSYWGNLNLHIDVHEIIFSSPSTFGKYYCSSSLFMPWFNPSLSLSETHTHSISRVLSFPQVHAFASVSFVNGLRVLSNIQVFLAFYSWFIPSFSSHLSHTYFYRRCALIFISNLLHLYSFGGVTLVLLQ